MADESTAVSNNSEIDIDELEVTVLMLVKNPRNHEAAATFMSRRGWPTKMVNNLQKAVKIITTEKPDFVLISMNFPHPAIGRLAPLFGQTFKVETVLFAEIMDATTIAQISKTKGHKLTGGASGPNIQRTLRRILQLKLNPQAASAEHDNGNNQGLGEQSDTMTVKGEGSTSKGSWNVIQPESKGTSSQSSYTFEGSGGESSTAVIENQKSNKKKKSLKDLNLPANGASAAGSVADEGNSSDHDLMSMLSQLVSQDGSSSEPGVIGNSGSGLILPNSQSATPAVSSGGSGIGLGSNQGGVFANIPQGSAATTNGLLDKVAKDKAIRDIIAPSIGGDRTIQGIKEQHGKYERLFQIVFKSIEKLGTLPGLAWSGPEAVEDIFVIPVDHPDLHGYLIVHSEEEMHAAKATFCDLLNDVMSEALVNELMTENQPGFEVGIPKTHFNNWLKGGAEFSISAEYFGTKFCVAFFKTEIALPKIKKGKIKDMIQVAVTDLSTEYPLNFKGYLKLERNNKLLLYLKTGRNFLPEQKARLISHEIKDICVKEIDEANLKKFLALSQLQKSLLDALKVAA